MPMKEIKRPNRAHGKPENNPLAETEFFDNTDFEDMPFPKAPSISDSPIPPVYGAIDTDLARDNMEIDLPKADIQNL